MGPGGWGWFAPADRPECVEQRILDVAAGLPEGAAVTGWAALRWRGARYLDGGRGHDLAPVPVALGRGTQLRPRAGVRLLRGRLDATTVQRVRGLDVTAPAPAAVDEVRLRDDLRSAVALLDIVLAARLVTRGQLEAEIAARRACAGVPAARRALGLAVADSWSPGETALRLVWMLDARLPVPMLNRRLVGDDGLYLGRPDLLDPATGLVGEYDGDWHLLDLDERRRGARRDDRFREHGLHPVTVYAPDLRDPVRLVARLTEAYERARGAPVEARRWRLLDSG